jgi:ubiquinone/menaquinone biosynthesis C-methylase UbiE
MVTVYNTMYSGAPKGYTQETALKYSEGQKQFFDIDQVPDGATAAMEAEIGALALKYPIHTVCDIGCGSNCTYFRKWKEAAKAKRFVGVEPSPHMREIAHAELGGGGSDEDIEVVSGDWEQLPFPDGSIDLAVSRFSLHHLENIEDGYRELSRILKSGGHAVISLPHPDYCAHELHKQGIIPKEGLPMSVEVFKTTLHYYYHEVDAYLGDSLGAHGLTLLKHASFNWGTTDEVEKQIPNTLLFVLEKV